MFRVGWKWRRLHVAWSILVRLSFWIRPIAISFIRERYTNKFTGEALHVRFLQPRIVSCGSWAFYLQPQSIGSCTKIFIRDWNLSFTLSSLSIFNRWSQKESFCANFRSKIEKLFTINKWLIAANWGKLHFVPQVCNYRWSPISPLHSSVICTFANTAFLD